jgi:thiol-disulfide isomerase/thioredoxin
MKYVLLTLFIHFNLPMSGQTFNECAQTYADEMKKIELKRTLKQITIPRWDSLRRVLDTNLNACITGKTAPDFNLTGRSGTTYTNELLKGKIVIMNFWSLNCGPCVGEIGVLNRLHQTYKDNTEVIFLSILLDKEDALEAFLQKGLTKRRIFYEVMPDSKAMIKELKLIRGYPTNLFIDRAGKVFMRTDGGITDPKEEEALESKFRSIIDGALNKT